MPRKYNEYDDVVAVMHILTVNRNINDIRPSRRRCNHAGSSNTCCVVRMDMNRKIGIFLPNGSNETGRDVWLACVIW
jgi:hypothetical protein